MTVLEVTTEDQPATCRATAAEGWPGAHPCTFRATRPSGMCGIHDNAARRREEAAEAAGRRATYARDTMARVGPLVRALTGLGIDAQPRLSGVLITLDAAERLIARLTSSTTCPPHDPDGRRCRRCGASLLTF